MKNLIITLVLLVFLTACGSEEGEKFATAENYNSQGMSGGTQYLGDSLTYLWPAELMLEGSYNRGIAGDQIQHVLDRMWLIEKEQPEEIYLMIGTNNLLFGMDLYDTLDLMNELLLQLAEYVPEAEIHVVSVLPVSRYSTYKVFDYNGMLEPMVLTHPNVVEFIDATDYFFFDGYAHYLEDKLHLVYAGYEVLSDLIASTRY